MKHVTVSFACSLCLTSLTGQSYGQEQSGGRRLDEIVIVTAPGALRTADELIGSASALERGAIVQSLSASLGDTLEGLPGVASTHFGMAAGRPVLRGLGAERVLVLSNGVGVIDASSASPDHQVAADGIDAEKIEVLRGPAALAYGGQAIGGVVNVIDGLVAESLPERSMSASMFGAYDSVNEGQEAAARMQQSVGRLVFNLSASMRDMGDYEIAGLSESAALRALEEEEGVDHDHEEEAGGDTLSNSWLQTRTLAGGVSWIADNGFLGVAVRRQEATYGLPGHGAHEEDHDEDHEEEHEEEHEEHEEHEEAGESPFIDLEQTRVELRGGLNVNAGPITDISASVVAADYTHTEFEAPGEAGTLYETDGVEARLEVGHVLAGLEGAVGAQWLDKSFGAFGDEAFITPTDTQILGVFLYEARDWANGAGIEGGLRWDTISYDNQRVGSEDFTTLGGSFGVHQHWENGVFLGGQASVTQRAPNESELFALGAHLATSQYEVGDSSLDKETGVNLEGTLRMARANWSLGLNVFQTAFEDFIYLSPGVLETDGEALDTVDGLPVFAFRQEDATLTGGEVYGEAYLSGVLGAEWTLAASLDHVRAKLDGGDNLPLVPPLTLNADVNADWGLWRLGAHVMWADEQDKTGVGELPTDSYTRVDLRAGLDLSGQAWAREGTEVFLDVRNVADEEARASTSVIKDTAPLPGRNIRIGFRLAL